MKLLKNQDERLNRPLLDYFGGKWRIAPKIISHFPEHKSFIDAMAGAGSITLRKPRSKNEILNDVNKELFNFFTVIRERNLELREALSKTPYSREEYYACRENSENQLEQARRTVVKSWFGIGDSLDNETGFRVSLAQAGSTTKPWVEYVDYLHLYAERLRGVILENLDYREIIKRYDKPDALFYFDPPYIKDTRSKKHAYRHDWDDRHHIEFVDLVNSIKGMWIISGYEHHTYEKLNARKVEIKTRTQFNESTEIIWIKEL